MPPTPHHTTPPRQRERRGWSRERAQLLTVIELQQRELGKRGGSVQERASEIARDFARSALSLNERLLTGACCFFCVVSCCDAVCGQCWFGYDRVWVLTP